MQDSDLFIVETRPHHLVDSSAVPEKKELTFGNLVIVVPGVQ